MYTFVCCVGEVIVSDYDSSEVQVSAMVSMGNNKLRFPVKADKICYSSEQVVKTIAEPQYISRRPKILKLKESDSFSCMIIATNVRFSWVVIMLKTFMQRFICLTNILFLKF